MISIKRKTQREEHIGQDPYLKSYLLV